MLSLHLKKLTNSFQLTGLISLFCLSVTHSSLAQITSDGTLSTNVTTSDNVNYRVTGGTEAGSNLFHSFREFSVPTGGEAFFDNSQAVQNIITRVTGGSISTIDGIIRANGSANLFLVNPAGILFGSNAQLNIGGSFLATTANQINFADGSVFSAVDAQSQPLLTVSVPIGLQFGNSPKEIINSSITTNDLGTTVGLRVNLGQTIALVGGNILLPGGQLSAPGGRIELASVGSNSFVSLSPIAQGWALGYEGVQTFQDIQLSQAAVIRTTAPFGENSGNILLQGRQINVIEGSLVLSFNNGLSQGGAIVIRASELVNVSDGSNIITSARQTGISGDITIETKQLIVRNGSFIDSSNQFEGQGGNLTINASESVEVDGGTELISALTTFTVYGSENAGNLQIKTGKLMVRNGGLIDSSTISPLGGNGGTVRIDASESVEIIGPGTISKNNENSENSENSAIFTGISARTRFSETTGNGGSLIINTGRLMIRDGGSISVAATQGSLGKAGALEINVSGPMIIDGTNSAILASSESPQPAGNVTINADELRINNSGQISVSSLGEGTAGNLLINTRNVFLNEQGAIKAETIGEQGNINLNVQEILSLRNNSNISATARGSGDGGNIDINSKFILATPNENSDITANAFGGRGGNITITTVGLFGIAPRDRLTPLSDINASSELGINGVIQINRPDFEPQDQLSQNPTEPESTQLAQGCQAEGEEAASRFFITGRGGLSSNPLDSLSTNNIWEDIQPPNPLNETAIKRQSTTSDQIVEAQGWFIDEQGKVILIAQSSQLMTGKCFYSSSQDLTIPK